jgi:prepilin-type N-terminal cleavage/methylation domain-containing protein
MLNRNNKGFTLIELMVVIVIIGILSALAIPKMFGVSSKAKAAEAPGVISNWETLQSAYSQETGQAGANDLIGFTLPMSNWFTYTPDIAAGMTAATGTLTASITVGMEFGDCNAADMSTWVSLYTAATDTYARSETGACPETYTPNFD